MRGHFKVVFADCSIGHVSGGLISSLGIATKLGLAAAETRRSLSQTWRDCFHGDVELGDVRHAPTDYDLDFSYGGFAILECVLCSCRGR